jgi:hypothetical protein
MWKDVDTFDEALEMLIRMCDNVGAVQQYVCIKDKITDPDLCWEEVKRLVKEEIENRGQTSGNNE